jgi:hypothetical protein
MAVDNETAKSTTLMGVETRIWDVSAGNCLLGAPLVFRVFRGTLFTDMGLGAVDEAAA